MDDPQKQLTERLIRLVEGLLAHTSPGGHGEWADLDLTMAQFKTLRLLGQRPQRMGDIAGYLGVSLSSATSMMDRLVSKGLAERAHDPTDRRVVACQLTPLGREHVERFWRIGRQKAELLAQALSMQDLETVVRAMEIITAALGKAGEARASPSSRASLDGRGPSSGPNLPVQGEE